MIYAFPASAVSRSFYKRKVGFGGFSLIRRRLPLFWGGSPNHVTLLSITIVEFSHALTFPRLRESNQSIWKVIGKTPRSMSVTSLSIPPPTLIRCHQSKLFPKSFFENLNWTITKQNQKPKLKPIQRNVHSFIAIHSSKSLNCLPFHPTTSQKHCFLPRIIFLLLFLASTKRKKHSKHTMQQNRSKSIYTTFFLFSISLS